MAQILEHTALSGGFMLLRVAEHHAVQCGQFYMLRGWDHYPVLSRPISVFDADTESVSFLYRIVGKGTALLSALKPGDAITLQGPYGHGFPAPEPSARRIAMVGGGVGIAPLYHTAKHWKQQCPETQVDLYLGFSEAAILVDQYKQVADHVVVQVGGYITDAIDPAQYEQILTCGPEIMMRALHNKCVQAGVEDRLWVSMENRMACGVGACLVCSCATQNGNRKVCKDGPVFAAAEVF